MTRNKVKLAYITDDNARKATFKKRRKGLMKKVSELAILCGIQACAIIFSPFGSQTEVWPDPEGAKQVIKRYKNTPVKDETKNVTQQSFTKQRIAKAKDQLNKQHKENRVKEMTLAMLEYMHTRKLPEDLTLEEVKDLDKLIDQYMKDIENKMAALG